MATPKNITRKLAIDGQSFVLNAIVKKDGDGSVLTFSAAPSAKKGKDAREIADCQMVWNTPYEPESKQLDRLLKQGVNTLTDKLKLWYRRQNSEQVED